MILQIERSPVQTRGPLEESQCVRTYANVTEPTAAYETAQLLMDEVDAEEATAGSANEAKATATQPPKAQG